MSVAVVHPSCPRCHDPLERRQLWDLGIDVWRSERRARAIGWPTTSPSWTCCGSRGPTSA